MGGKQNLVFSDGNSIGIWCSTYYADGANRYSSILGSTYDRVKSPFYIPSTFSYTYLNVDKKVKCVFKCYQYLIKDVMYATTAHTFSPTFTAGCGDLFETTSF